VINPRRLVPQPQLRVLQLLPFRLRAGLLRPCPRLHPGAAEPPIRVRIRLCDDPKAKHKPQSNPDSS